MRVAFISLHTSPAERAGTADAGGMNVLIRALSKALQGAGAHVEFFTRRSSPDQPDTQTLDDGLIVHHVTAGPQAPLPKSQIDQYIDEFRTNLGSLDRFDLVLAMDRQNLADLEELAAGAPTTTRIALLRDFDPSAPDGAEVPDPYYGGERGFVDVYDMVERACRGVLDHLCAPSGHRGR